MTSPTATASTNAALELAQLEVDARDKAFKHVAGLLQRPDQLEKVEQIRKRVSRKKSSVEAMLKTAVQSQLDGVRTGLNQLQNALNDIHQIKDSLVGIDETYQSIDGLGTKLQKLREENSRHSTLAAAVENLKHIFSVPETVKKCEELINDGKLLHAHKCLTDLETSRDDLLFELHKQTTQSPTDKCTVSRYFEDVEHLSQDLSKQLWVILQRTLMMMRREPTMIVTVLRVIEREERTDSAMLKRYDQTGFIPPGRPKRWRQKAFEVIEKATHDRIEGNQMADRDTDKMWLVRHLEVTRQMVIEDLKVIKTLCDNCFPPHYDMVNKYIQMYHNGISERLVDVVQQGLQGNEIITLLTWIRDYNSPELMKHRDLMIDTSEFPPLLDTSYESQLQNQYLQTMRQNFAEWMGNSLTSDIKYWYHSEKPEADDKGFFNTALPVLLFQMIEQNVAVAGTISDKLVLQVLHLFMDEMDMFISVYRGELQKFQEKYLLDRDELPFYTHYMVANINNLQVFADLTSQMPNKFLKDSGLSVAPQRLNVVTTKLQTLANDSCDGLLDMVMLDLNKHIERIFTSQWLARCDAVDIISLTIEDYFGDFVHLRAKYFDYLWNKARDKITVEYLRALFSGRMRFKTYDDRMAAADTICKESEQLSRLFDKLSARARDSSPFECFPQLAEMIRMKDSSMMSLEITDFVVKFPDIRSDQLITLLVMRNDMSRSEARQMVNGTLGEDHDSKPKTRRTIFSDPTL